MILANKFTGKPVKIPGHGTGVVTFWGQLYRSPNEFDLIRTFQSIEVDSRLNSTLTNKVLPKSLITKPCTMSEVHEMIKQKTFTIFER